MKKRPKKLTEAILFNIDKPTKELLTSIAENNGTSVAHLIRQAVRKLLEQAKVGS